MHLSRTNSEVNIYSPFLLKFQGRMTQISKKGTLTAPPPLFAASFHNEAKKQRAALLTEKRADNILMDLNEIKNKNAKDLQHITNCYESPIKKPEDCMNTVVEYFAPSPTALCQNMLVDGKFSDDFKKMLKSLDNLSSGRKNK